MQTSADREHAGMSAGMTLLLAATAGISVANLYIAQPMIGLIGPSIGLHPGGYGLVVTLTQIGYACGLLLLVPLGDFVENRRLMVTTLGCGAVTLLVTSFVRSATPFLVACFVVGIMSVTTQMVVPLASHLADPRKRGRQVATVVSGLLTGILFGRPIASLIASVSGWRSVFLVASAAMAIMAIILWRCLPERRPEGRKNYFAMLASMVPLMTRTPLLQRRMAYQTSLFFAFTVFWTAIPLELSRHFGLGQSGIAIFSLVGAAGALSAPIAGRFADAGKVVAGTAISMAMVAIGVALTWPGSLVHGWTGLIILGVATVLLDGGVQANQAFSMKVLFDLPPEVRSRVNAVYIACAFLGAALGSALAPLALSYAGWPLVALLAVIPPVCVLTFFLIRERRRLIASPMSR
jgi:predicted MFS family arabinose efflux permease